MRDKVVRWKERVKKRVKARMETERGGGLANSFLPFRNTNSLVNPFLVQNYGFLVHRAMCLFVLQFLAISPLQCSDSNKLEPYCTNYESYLFYIAPHHMTISSDCYDIYAISRAIFSAALRYLEYHQLDFSRSSQVSL